MWNPSRAPCPNSACWKKLTRSLIEDIAPLLPAGVRFNGNDAIHAFERVWKELITRIKGDAWKLTDKALEELRVKNIPVC